MRELAIEAERERGNEREGGNNSLELRDWKNIFQLSSDESSDLNSVNTRGVKLARSRITSKVKGQLCMQFVRRDRME